MGARTEALTGCSRVRGRNARLQGFPQLRPDAAYVVRTDGRCCLVLPAKRLIAGGWGATAEVAAGSPRNALACTRVTRTQGLLALAGPSPAARTPLACGVRGAVGVRSTGNRDTNSPPHG